MQLRLHPENPPPSSCNSRATIQNSRAPSTVRSPADRGGTTGSPAVASPHFIKFLLDGFVCEFIALAPRVGMPDFCGTKACYSPRPVLIIFHPSLSLLSTSAFVSAVMP